jgi:ABC-type sulfate/molybdate transport systems ATPase subunit
MNLLKILVFTLGTVQSLLSYNLEEKQYSQKHSHMVYNSHKTQYSQKQSHSMFYSTIKHSNQVSFSFNVKKYISRHQNKHSTRQYSQKQSQKYSQNLFSTMVQSYRRLPEPVFSRPTIEPTPFEIVPYLPYDMDDLIGHSDV